MLPAGKPKRKPPRKACNRCPACLAQPCKECSNCTNANSNKRCKRRQCPYLALPSSASSAAPALSSQIGTSSSPPQPGTSSQPGSSSSPLQPGTSAQPGTSTQPGSSLTSAILSVLPRSAAAALSDSPSPGELGEGGPAQKRSSSMQQDEQETGGRKRQRLQEDHLRVEATFNNYVLVKKSPKGYVGQVYQCLKCNSDFPTRIICIRHAFNCGKTFTGKKRGKNTRQITCNICPFKTTTEGELAKHRRDAHKEVTSQRVRCLTCNETFASVKSLKKHIMNVHKNSDMKKCGECGKYFASQYNLKRHLDTHQRNGAQRERDRLAFREVDLNQWGAVSLGGDVDVGGGVQDGGAQQVDDEAGSDVDDDPALSSPSDRRQGFSMNQLAEAFTEQCRRNGDTEPVLRERRRLLQEKLLKKVSPCISTSSASSEPSTSSPAPTEPSTSSPASTEPPGATPQVGLDHVNIFDELRTKSLPGKISRCSRPRLVTSANPLLLRSVKALLDKSKLYGTVCMTERILGA